ncbi:hypothetical protein R9C00_23130 [Flammeovirgaceae bacterium SG7u.111]|nr:hypothetical protein [Flammeovirgaceae bacterium SG7u.132]WPO34599.1 hypothetical protein R9C00_23130 [Flammeovirgaceae bacterium SG7u.111]
MKKFVLILLLSCLQACGNPSKQLNEKDNKITLLNEKADSLEKALHLLDSVAFKYPPHDYIKLFLGNNPIDLKLGVSLSQKNHKGFTIQMNNPHLLTNDKSKPIGLVIYLARDRKQLYKKDFDNYTEFNNFNSSKLVFESHYYQKRLIFEFTNTTLSQRHVINVPLID